MAEKIDLNTAIKEIVSSPIIRVDRESFLRTALSHHFDEDTVQRAIEISPAYAGITVDEIKKISDATINLEASKTTALSFAAGIPGGLAMIGTIPADIAQYLIHIFVVVQKLIYLYGWPDLLDESGQMDDGTAAILIQFIGVMYGVKESVHAINVFSKRLARQLAKEVAEEAAEQALQKATGLAVKQATGQAVKKAVENTAEKAISKTIIRNTLKYGADISVEKTIKQTAVSTGTKTLVKKGAIKAIPLIGGFISGTLTYASFYPMARRFRNYLAGLKQAKVIDKNADSSSNREPACEC